MLTEKAAEHHPLKYLLACNEMLVWQHPLPRPLHFEETASINRGAMLFA